MVEVVNKGKAVEAELVETVVHYPDAGELLGSCAGRDVTIG